METNWILESLNLYREYGKETYKGNVKFRNGTESEISFALDQTQTHRFLALIQDAMNKSAKELGQKLVLSMPTALPESIEPNDITQG